MPAITAQCLRNRMTRRSVGSRYSSMSRGASTRAYTKTWVTKSIIDWPAPASEVPMLRTDIAALPGCEITKNTRSTIASVPRIFLTFIQTTVRAFSTTRRGSLYRTAATKPSVSPTRGVKSS